MIDFRYHIVSLIAVFLALALGIALGATVVSGPLEARLRGDLERAREARSDARAHASEVEGELSQLETRLRDQVGPWATRERVAGRPILVVAEAGTDAWREDVVRRIIEAGAVFAGSITFAERGADTDAARADLVERVRAVVPGFDPGADAVASAFRTLGERILDPAGLAIAGTLEAAGILDLNRTAGDPWPPRDLAIMVAGGVHRPGGLRPAWTASFALGAAAAAPTLVLAPEPGPLTAVAALRDEEDTPATLVTFDAAGPAGDPGGMGVVAAFESSLARRGGHFGTGQDARFVPGP